MIEIEAHHFVTPPQKIIDLNHNHWQMRFEWKVKYDWLCVFCSFTYICVMPLYLSMHVSLLSMHLNSKISFSLSFHMIRCEKYSFWEGVYVYLWLIHAEVWQKTAKFCKAIILQKNKLNKKKKYSFWQEYHRNDVYSVYHNRR